MKKPEVYNGKESIFNKQCQSNWMSACRGMQVDLYLSSYTKLKSKFIEDIQSDTLKLVVQNVADRLEHIGTEDNFLNKTPKAKSTGTKINN